MRKTALFIITMVMVLMTGCAALDGVLTEEVVTTDPITGVITTNLVANPNAQAGAQLINLAPFPYAGLVGALLSSVIAGYAGIRNRQKSTQLSRQQKVIGSIIQGVELAGSAAAEVKKQISKAAQGAGVTAEVHSAVKASGG